ncbi:MAG: hypothetical protein B7Z66_11285 [Chromatiales bacterium 21-64-14]|nr:MAG: hypothetical protein B7Z66_11285 [Chromatiales bacterium 21-64-14]HQU16755.1 PAS domain S-box protein [Gammaproteobacteria bacterium]
MDAYTTAITFDADGRVLFIGGATTELVGTNTGAAAGRFLADVLCPPIPATLQALLSVRAEASPLQATHQTLELCGINGTAQTFSARFQPIHDPWGTYIGGTLLLSASVDDPVQAPIQRWLDVLPVEAFYLDRDQRIRFVNRAFREHHGIHTSEPLGAPLRAVLGDTAYRQVQPYIERAMAGNAAGFETELAGTGEAARYVLVTYNPDIDSNGVVRGLFGAVYDITGRRRAEQRLQEALRHLQALYDASPDMIFLHRPDGRLLDVNSNAQRRYGYSREEMLDTGLHELMGAGCTLAEAVKRIGRVVAGEDLDFEWVAKQRDGQEFPVEIRLRRLADTHGAEPGEPQVLAVVRDITAQKQAQAELRAHEHKFRALVEQSLVGIYIIQENCLVYVNPGMAKIFGYRPEEMVAIKRLEDLVIPEDQEFARRNLARRFRGEILALPYPLRCLRADGRAIDVEVHGVRTDYDGRPAVIGALVDMTERVRAEQALHRLTDRLRILTDLDRGILGLRSRENMAGSSLRHVRRLIPGTCASITEIDHASSRCQVIASDAEYPMSVSAGTHFPLHHYGEIARATPDQIFRFGPDQGDKQTPPAFFERFQERGLLFHLVVPLFAHGALIGTLNLSAQNSKAFSDDHLELAREVSARLAIALHQARLTQEIRHHAAELEDRVATRTAQLEETNSELQSFAYSISHDLRAPLRAMHGFANAIMEDYAEQLDDTAREYARRIVAAASRMDGLIQDLLTYTRVGRGEIRHEPVDLERMIKEIQEELAREIEGLGARVEVEHPLLSVHGHRYTVRQALLNLLTNALKFVPPGVPPRIRLYTERRSEAVRLWVEDNGIGIHPRHYEQIFGLCERLHGSEAYPGSGIGLAIVRKGMQRLGGSAGLEPSAGGGSRFWLELPPAETPR